MNVGLEVSAGPSDRTIPAFVAFDLLIFAEERKEQDGEEQQDADSRLHYSMVNSPIAWSMVHFAS